MIPAPLAEALHRALRASPSRPDARPPVAAFDLDGTLLRGDIGEAVFARLLEERAPLGLDWAAYQKLLEVDRAAAYRSLVSAMRGLTVEQVEESTAALIRTRDRYIPVEETFIPVPRPYPVMQSVVEWLMARGVEVHVISASNHWSVQVVARAYFGIPEQHAHGIRSRVCGKLLTDVLVEPVPVHAGKAALYLAQIGSMPPIITAGDSVLDVPLFRLTAHDGCSLWMGEEAAAATMRARFALPQPLYTVSIGEAVECSAFRKHQRMGASACANDTDRLTPPARSRSAGISR